jgi:hypothetical protein
MAAKVKEGTDSETGAISASFVRPAISLGEEFEIPTTWTEEPYNKEFVVSQVGTQSVALYKNRLNMLYGTTPAMVISAFLKRLFIARKEQAPKQLIIDMIFSVFVSQTVSREWAAIYNQFPATSTFKSFEISGTRTVDPKVPQSQWVASSLMNATAVGMLGHAIMSIAPENSSLGKKAEADGTIFAPKKKDADKLSEYGKITLEVSKTLTDADFDAVDAMKSKAGHLVILVCSLLESESNDLTTILTALDKLKIKKF